ncbi:hypothetical protein D3C78_1331400 [compost metagenome]
MPLGTLYTKNSRDFRGFLSVYVIVLEIEHFYNLVLVTAKLKIMLVVRYMYLTTEFSPLLGFIIQWIKAYFVNIRCAFPSACII